jgi:zinc/manganese transport system permease protein
VAAALVGAPLAAGAAGGALLGAAGAGVAARDRRLGTDLGVGVTITAALSAGALLALLGPDPERLEALLFGDLLAVRPGEVVVSASLSIGVLAALWARRRALAVCALDPTVAPSLGCRPARVEGQLLVALAVTLVAAVAAIGSLLALALVVAPAAAARRLGDRLSRVLALAAGIAVADGLIGLAVGLWLGLEPSAVVALVAIATFALAGTAVRALNAPPKRL